MLHQLQVFLFIEKVYYIDEIRNKLLTMHIRIHHSVFSLFGWNKYVLVETFQWTNYLITYLCSFFGSNLILSRNTFKTLITVNFRLPIDGFGPMFYRNFQFLSGSHIPISISVVCFFWSNRAHKHTHRNRRTIGLPVDRLSAKFDTNFGVDAAYRIFSP